MKNLFMLLILVALASKAFSQAPLTIKNQLIIDSEGNGSGLKFTGINASTTASTVPTTLLTLDAQGNVVVGQTPIVPAGASVWSLNNTTASTLATSVVIGANINIPANNPYSLYVSKGILTEKMRVSVANSTFWADYVFDKNYKLPTLASVEKFIALNKHLPDVPSSQEVTENGIDFTEMQATLLRKIEELTLYTIALEKKVTRLQKQMKTSKRSNKE
ncbi:MAG: hypothetical protein ACOVOW_12680 [Spirosomataceae bacterium]